MELTVSAFSTAAQMITALHRKNIFQAVIRKCLVGSSMNMIKVLTLVIRNPIGDLLHCPFYAGVGSVTVIYSASGRIINQAVEGIGYKVG